MREYPTLVIGGVKVVVVMGSMTMYVHYVVSRLTIHYARSPVRCRSPIG